jgi:hypothetical protein
MDISIPHSLSRPIRFDAKRRRLWICGQRCHHGATGVVITATAGAVLARKQLLAPTRATLAGARAASGVVIQSAALAAVGSLMMLHDWKDHSIWFELGPGSQP